MQYHIITFGCQMNKSDSERIAAVLEKTGYQKAQKIDEANLIVINMCSVRQSAVDRIYGLAPKFKKLKKNNPLLKTVLTGCILKYDLKKFEKIFDYILSIKTLFYWKEILLKNKKHIYYPDLRSPRVNKKFGADYFCIAPHHQNNFSAYVPIMTGCNNFCTYCVVPYARGPEICRPAEEIIKEVEQSAQKGFKEIWLLGHNVNSYGVQRRTTQKSAFSGTQNHAEITFSELLKTINKIPGNFWIRFLSSHPNDFSDELIRTIKECEKVTEYISLPVQSGDNQVLKKMNRPYTVSQYKELVKKIRKNIPNVCLSTDVIVGFPGETKEQFRNTVNLFEELKFDMAYIAEYSPRPGTVAFKMEDDVASKEKQKRREILTKILEKTSVENSQKYIGKTVDVLIHEKTKKDDLIGKTRFYKTVKLPCVENCSCYIGKIVKAKIIDVMPWGLRGIKED